MPAREPKLYWLFLLSVFLLNGQKCYFFFFFFFSFSGLRWNEKEIETRRATKNKNEFDLLPFDQRDSFRFIFLVLIFVFVRLVFHQFWGVEVSSLWCTQWNSVPSASCPLLPAAAHFHILRLFFTVRMICFQWIESARHANQSTPTRIDAHIKKKCRRISWQLTLCVLIDRMAHLGNPACNACIFLLVMREKCQLDFSSMELNRDGWCGGSIGPIYRTNITDWE